MAPLLDSEFQQLLVTLKELLNDSGFSLNEQRNIDYGVSLCFEGGGMLNVYNGKKGPKAVLAGKFTGDEKTAIQDAASQVLGDGSRPTAKISESGIPSNLMAHRQPWIGCDESGKGDYFGPLVVAAVAVSPDQVSQLIDAGIRDSKVLTNSRALKLSGWIEKNLPCATRVLEPREYNSRYSGNLNHLLSTLHAEVIGELAQRQGIDLAISDQFGNPARIRKELSMAGHQVELTSLPRAEADVAVAAASILARGNFLDALRRLGTEATIDLPPGAGPPVLAAGRKMVDLFGVEELGNFAKVHFKTTQQIV